MMPIARQILAGGAFAALLTTAAATFASMPTSTAAAQDQAATKTLANERYRFTVAVPAGCRQEEGPGTVDAVCSSDLDPEHSARVRKAAALVMGVAAEMVPADSGKTVAELAQLYGEPAFRDELPEAICGESNQTRVKLENVQPQIEATRVVYVAEVTCAAVKFLQIGERHASVRYLIGPDARYRLVARALTDDFAKHKQTIEAFFASFRVLPIGNGRP
jgi:hypothetical protein